ncbi:MAG: hypothetical protein H6766_02230 [Candidatus Peribacteria bacterium]|nr:MAG: hypothetical protein H6766_02230 [Candidatus Peribacteria bacterium]
MISSYDEAIEKIFTTETMNDYSLEKVRQAYELLGRPLDGIQVIHIAGTNGKGSVAHMTFAILQEAGISVGVFTSPHLVDIRERFETDTGLISESKFVQYTNQILSIPFSLSYFEKCTLIAMLLFANRGVEYAILEVGMGGRLDATNICTPTITAITSIGLDHQDILGDTIEQISYEKAGIIKPGIPIIINHYNPTIESIASERDAPLIYTDRECETNLRGPHQYHNAGIAYEIAHYLGIDDETIHT